MIIIWILLILCTKLIIKNQNGQINGKEINTANITNQYLFLIPLLK